MFDGELIKWKIRVVSTNNPVSPRPHFPRSIVLIAIGIRIARRFQPLPGHVFAVARILKKAINQAFVGIGTLVAEEGLGFFESRGETSQVQGGTANEC